MIKKFLVVMLLSVVTVQASEELISRYLGYKKVSAGSLVAEMALECEKLGDGRPYWDFLFLIEGAQQEALRVCCQASHDRKAQALMLKLHEAFKQTYDCTVDEQGFFAQDSYAMVAGQYVNTIAGQVFFELLDWEKQLKKCNRKIVAGDESRCSLVSIETSEVFVSIAKDNNR